MGTATTTPHDRAGADTRVDWAGLARELGPVFAARAPAYDADDAFAADNYRDLRERSVFSAPVPEEMGGGGASYGEVCAMLRELGRHCGSTALALAMHMHLAAGQIWLHRHGAPTRPLLERIAAEQLVLVTTAAHDWLDSDGTAERVDGGFRVTGRKRFASGSPAGGMLLTSAVYADPDAGPTVLHLGVPLDAPGVGVLDNWRTMGMRATGSNDVVLDGVFVPDAAVGSRRPRGEWPPFLSVVACIALPAIASVYVGIGEAARDLAVERAAARRDDPTVWTLIGEMDTALAAAGLAADALVAPAADLDLQPDLGLVNRAMMAKTIATEALLRLMDLAMEAAGGGGYFRGAGLERMLRDMHAIRFHPLPPARQRRFTGRLALGLDPTR